jgi:hypothetical protein
LSKNVAIYWALVEMAAESIAFPLLDQQANSFHEMNQSSYPRVKKCSVDWRQEILKGL